MRAWTDIAAATATGARASMLRGRRKLLLCLVFFGFSRNARNFDSWRTAPRPASAPGKQADQQAQREPALVVAHGGEAGQQGHRRRRQGRGDAKAQGFASRHRPHRRQEDRPQESGVANEVAPRARDQGDGLTSTRAFRIRAPPGALFHVSERAGMADCRPCRRSRTHPASGMAIASDRRGALSRRGRNAP